MVMFFYVTKSDVFAIGKDLVCMHCQGFLLGGLTGVLDYSSKSGSLTLGKNLTWYPCLRHVGAIRAASHRGARVCQVGPRDSQVHCSFVTNCFHFKLNAKRTCV